MGTLICEIADARDYVNTYADDGTNVLSATRAFRVESTSNSEGPRSILSTAGLPSPWDPHPEDATIYAKTGVAKQQTSDPRIWICTFNYDDRVSRYEVSATPGGAPDPDPTTHPITVNYSFEKFTRVESGLTWDDTNKTWQTGFENSAGEPFDPQPEFDDSRPTFVFQENMAQADFNWANLITYQDAVNNAAIWGLEARTLKIQNITAGPKQTVKKPDDSLVTYRVVTYTIQYREDTWDLKILDQGTYSTQEHDGETMDGQPESAPVRWPFKDSEDNPTTRKLNGSGILLPDDQPPKFEIFQVYNAKDFSALNLPNPMA